MTWELTFMDFVKDSKSITKHIFQKPEEFSELKKLRIYPLRFKTPCVK